ncbi:MAG: hypothetical protein RL033_6023, partial [Pseudomonadota bacterium]
MRSVRRACSASLFEVWNNRLGYLYEGTVRTESLRTES